MTIIDNTEYIENHQEEVHFDPNYQHARFKHGDVTVIITWNFADPSREPMMVLAPTFAPPAGCDIHIQCIPQKDAWKYSRTHHYEKHTPDALNRDALISAEYWQDNVARLFALMLRLDAESKSVRIHIRSAIEDHLDDLLRCPPAPVRASETGEAVFEVKTLGSNEAPREVIVKEH